MSYEDPTPSPSAGNNTVLIIVVVLLGVFLLLGAICGGVVYFTVKTTERMVESFKDVLEEQQRHQAESQRAAQVFIEDIRANRVEQAHRSMTPELQERMPLAEWQKLLAKYPGLTEARAGERIRVSRQNPFDEDGEYDFEAEVSLGMGKQGYLKLRLHQDGESWKIDTVEISDRPPPKKQ